MIKYEELPQYLQKNRKSIEGTVLGVLFQDIMSVKEYNLDDIFITNEGMILYKIVKTLSDNNVLKATDLDIKLQCKPSLVKEYTDLGGFKMVEILMKTTELENANSYVDSLLKNNMLISFYEDGLDLTREIVIDTKKGQTQISWLDLADKMTTDELLNFKESRDSGYLPVSINNNVKEHVGEISLDFIENLENGAEIGMMFGEVLSSKFLPTLSKEILGLKKKTLNLLASSINVGKSTVLSNMALSLASNGHRVLLITNEEEISSFMIKFLTYLINNEVGYNKLNQKKIKSGSLSDEDKQKLREARNIYNEKIADNLIICSMSTMDMSTLKKLIRKYALSSKGLDIMLFDTFKFSSNSAEGDDWKALSKQTREIHELTKIYDICGLLTYQLAMSNNGSLFLDIGMLANSKQVGETLDEMFLMRTLYKEELDKNSKAYCKPFKRVKTADGKWIEREVELTPDSNYRVLFLRKISKCNCVN